MNLLLPQDWSSLNILAGVVGLYGFKLVAIFGFGGLVESFFQDYLLSGYLKKC